MSARAAEGCLRVSEPSVVRSPSSFAKGEGRGRGSCEATFIRRLGLSNGSLTVARRPGRAGFKTLRYHPEVPQGLEHERRFRQSQRDFRTVGWDFNPRRRRGPHEIDERREVASQEPSPRLSPLRRRRENGLTKRSLHFACWHEGFWGTRIKRWPAKLLGFDAPVGSPCFGERGLSIG